MDDGGLEDWRGISNDDGGTTICWIKGEIVLVDNGGSNGEGSFKFWHGSDAVEITMLKISRRRFFCFVCFDRYF